MCTCSIFVCRHKNNDMSTLLGHAHTYIPTDRQTDTQAYIHKSIQTYSYTYTWLHMCVVSPLWGGGWGGTRGGWIIYMNMVAIWAKLAERLFLQHGNTWRKSLSRFTLKTFRCNDCGKLSRILVWLEQAANTVTNCSFLQETIKTDTLFIRQLRKIARICWDLLGTYLVLRMSNPRSTAPPAHDNPWSPKIRAENLVFTQTWNHKQHKKIQITCPSCSGYIYKCKVGQATSAAAIVRPRLRITRVKRVELRCHHQIPNF